MTSGGPTFQGEFAGRGVSQKWELTAVAARAVGIHIHADLTIALEQKSSSLKDIYSRLFSMTHVHRKLEVMNC